MATYQRKFDTIFRGMKVTVDLRATVGPDEATIEAEFWKDGKPYTVKKLNRFELADLCREAQTIADKERFNR